MTFDKDSFLAGLRTGLALGRENANPGNLLLQANEPDENTGGEDDAPEDSV